MNPLDSSFPNGPHDPGSRPGARPEEATTQRIALVTTELGVGGAERCLVRLAVGLRAGREFKPVVYALAPPPSPPRDALVQRLKEADVELRFLGLTSSWQFPVALNQLTKLLRGQRPHLLQSFLFHANVIGVMAGRRAGVPRLVTGVRVADPRRWRLRGERWVCRNVDRIVCVSQSVADFCRCEARYPEDRLSVIPNGITVERFEGARPADLTQFGIPATCRPLLFVGRLDPQKGLDWLLSVLPPLLRDELPEQHFLIVGDGPQRAALEALARSSGTASRIHFAGWQSDVGGLYAASELVVLPSRWEGMPNVVLEAMAAGRPVLASRVSGVDELLGPLADEQTFGVENENEFRRKLLAMNKKEVLGGIAAKNHERAKTQFSVASMVDQYVALYRQILAPRSRQ